MVYFPVPQKGLSFKLLAKYDETCKIIGKLDRLTYRVRSIKNERREFVVHVQRIYKYTPYEPSKKKNVNWAPGVI